MELARDRLGTVVLLDWRWPLRAALKLVLAGVVAALVLRRPGPGVLAGLALYAVLVERKLRNVVPGRVTGVERLVRAARPGDLVMCRSYQSADMVELLLFRHLAAALAKRAFYSHVGVVVERGGRKYVLDSVADVKMSHLTMTRKSGVVMRPLDEFVEGYRGRVQLFSNDDLSSRVCNDRLLAYAERVAREPFGWVVGGLTCVETVTDAFRDQGLLTGRVMLPEALLDLWRYGARGDWTVRTARNEWAK
jgi:hypothetical protein